MLNSISLFIFHRDYRLNDNLGLIKAQRETSICIPIFIFTPDQTINNKYRSDKSLYFLIQSLLYLGDEIHIEQGKLYTFYGDTILVLKSLISELKSKYNIKITHIYENQDFTPYAKQRQKNIAKLCNDTGLQYILCHDLTLLPIDTIMTSTNTAFKKFTPFYNKALECQIPKPKNINNFNFLQIKNFKTENSKVENSKMKKNDGKKLKYGISKSEILEKFNFLTKNEIQNLAEIPTRKHGLEILKNIAKFNNYSDVRNHPIENTTRLSAHLHFGTISIRELYWALKKQKNVELIRQLFWREFYMYVVNFHHLNYSKLSDTLPKFNKIQWDSDSTHKEYLHRWKTATTGIPIVDAGIRELLSTGFMHNRVRIIVAEFLIHYCGVHWKFGEEFFAQNLVDYSYCNNFGGWVCCAGMEVHSMNIYRLPSLSIQAKKIDPKCEYIYKWIPELKTVALKSILNWDSQYINFIETIKYPKPMLTNLDKLREKRIKYLSEF